MQLQRQNPYGSEWGRESTPACVHVSDCGELLGEAYAMQSDGDRRNKLSISESVSKIQQRF